MFRIISLSISRSDGLSGWRPKYGILFIHLVVLISILVALSVCCRWLGNSGCVLLPAHWVTSLDSDTELQQLFAWKVPL
jgi:hypothetical protein